MSSRCFVLSHRVQGGGALSSSLTPARLPLEVLWPLLP